jgi:ArsR family transcriptional regulator
MKRSPRSTDVLRAFADATRLRILSLLIEQKELCVCDLCTVLAESQPKVSRHLATLRRVGLVDVRQDGKWKYYSLPGAPSPLQRTLLRCVGSCLGEIDELAADRTRLRGLEKGLRCT